jgi:hypothetical protein
LTEAGAELWLNNGSGREISVRGHASFWKGWIDPWDSILACKSSKPHSIAESDGGIIHGDYDLASVAPGHRQKLLLGSDLPRKYRGGSCRLHLQLHDGSVIELPHFVP